jgi:hypothetical protein
MSKQKQFKRMATKYTAFRCPEDLLAKAKVKADGERRSLSNYIVMLIEKNTQDIPDAPKVEKKKATKPKR